MTYYSRRDVDKIAFWMLGIGFAAGALVSCSIAAANAPTGCDRRLQLCQLDLAACVHNNVSKNPKNAQ